MLEPIPKHNITKNIQNNYPLKSYKEKKDKHLNMINDLDNDNIENNIINLEKSSKHNLFQ
jgi:hypothetical protein